MSEPAKNKGGRPRKEGPREPNGRLKRPYKPRERRVLKPSEDIRLQVEQMVAVGEDHETIALSIGRTVKSLQRDFASELKFGLARRRREAIDLVFVKAREGHPASIERVYELTKVNGAEKAFEDTQRVDEVSEQPQSRRRYIGKKEQAQEAARTAGEGTEWGDDLVPPEHVNTRTMQ